MLAERALPIIAFAALVLAPSLACTAGTSSTNCSLNTCNSGATVKIYANISAAEMAQSTVTACLNDGCVNGAPASVPSTPGSRLNIALQGALTVQGYISSPDPVKGYLIEADFELSETSLTDGDSYKLAVISNGEAVPGQLNQAATYVKSSLLLDRM